MAPLPCCSRTRASSPATRSRAWSHSTSTKGSIWALHRHATRAPQRQIALTLLVLACIGLGPLAVARGLPLPWGLLLLSLGPIIAVAYHGHGRVHCAESFAVR